MLNIELSFGDFQGDLVPPAGENIAIGPTNSLYSPSGAFRFTFQTDGNIVLQHVNDSNLARKWESGQPLNPGTDMSWTPIWATGTNGTGTNLLYMQSDGNLVAFNKDVGGRATFASNTAGNPGAFLRMQDDGNLVIYNTSGVAIWSTRTYARRGG